MDKSSKKSSKITMEGKQFLTLLVEESRHVVECKKTDDKTNYEKEAEWERIALQFNVKFPNEQRSGPQLQVCWKNLKSAAKKDFARCRRSKLVTGGGEGEPEPDSL